MKRVEAGSYPAPAGTATYVVDWFGSTTGMDHGQLPPFDRIGEDAYLSGMVQGMAAQRSAVDAIAASETPPTFDNTVLALELSGRLLERVWDVLSHQVVGNASDGLRKIQAAVGPRLTAHRDDIFLNQALFHRVREVWQRRDTLDLSAESRHLIDHWYRRFLRAGAALGPEDRATLRRVNQELSELGITFQRLLMAGTEESAVVVDDVRDLRALPAEAVAAAEHAAVESGRPGGHLLRLVLRTHQPALAHLTRRDVRERLWRASVGRAADGGPHDTSAVVKRIAALRAQRARLFGCRHHAELALAEGTAGSADAVDRLISGLVPGALAMVRGEAAAIAEQARRDGVRDTLRPWDWAYYSDRVRAERFGVSAADIAPYLELESVLRRGVFHAATALYGVTFQERPELPTYHPDVRTFEVFDADGTPLGLFLADLFARAGKHNGPWMHTFVHQSGLLGQLPVVVVNLSVTPPPRGGAALLNVDEVTNLFHEFGHALHGLFSSVRYPSLAGVRIPLDVIEFPSQVNEMWAFWPEVLHHYARHHVTGEPVPDHLVSALTAARNWGEGFMITEYLKAAVVDQAWHRLQGEHEVPADIDDFEARAVAAAGLDVDLIPPRYGSRYFSHIWAGDYHAGYYSYIWSEVLAADAIDWFTENGGLRRENGDRFRATILAPGGSVDMLDAYRRFRGRDASVDALLRQRGLIST